VDPGASALLGEHTSVKQHLEVVADRWLAPVENFNQVAGTYLAAGTARDQADQTQAHRIGQHPQYQTEFRRIVFRQRIGAGSDTTSKFDGVRHVPNDSEVRRKYRRLSIYILTTINIASILRPRANIDQHRYCEYCHDQTQETEMSRLQLALNVDDLDQAIDFYTRMFGTEPLKVESGYANFAITDPPLKLVLFEGGETGTINHLGVEVETKVEVSEAEARLVAEGLDTTGVEDTLCCYAEKTETWLSGPDGTRWEWYVKNGDSTQFENTVTRATVVEDRNVCCGPAATAAGTVTAGAGKSCC
jgi:catechol 2,3-dioxygenase-like lactoylglutathione lyase family enzyme